MLMDPQNIPTSPGAQNTGLPCLLQSCSLMWSPGPSTTLLRPCRPGCLPRVHIVLLVPDTRLGTLGWGPHSSLMPRVPGQACPQAHLP